MNCANTNFIENSHASIIASRVNSDVVENMFCQQRTFHNEANTNLTYLGYFNTVNSVILGQHTVSKKSNTGGGDGAQLCDMFLQHVKKVFKKMVWNAAFPAISKHNNFLNSKRNKGSILTSAFGFGQY